MAFDVGSIRAQLTLDRTEFNRELEQAETQAKKFAATSFEAKLGLDLSKLTRDIAEAKAYIKTLEEVAEVEIKADADDYYRVATSVLRTTEGIDGEKADVDIGADASRYNTITQEIMARMANLDRVAAEPKIGANPSEFDTTTQRVGRTTDAIDRDRADVEIGADDRVFEQKSEHAIVTARAIANIFASPRFGARAREFESKAASTTEKVRALDALEANPKIGARDDVFSRVFNNTRRRSFDLGKLNPMVIIGAINDPFMFSAKVVANKARELGRMRPTIKVRADTAQARREMGLLANGTDRVFKSGASVANLFGRDGSLIRGIGSIASGFINLGTKAVGAASGLARVGGGAASAGGALGALKGAGLPGIALSIAGVGASSFFSATALGLLFAAIVPILAILATGVATIAAVGIGFGLMGAAGALLAKDFGTVANATRRVENAQIALDDARKKAAPAARKAAQLERDLTQAQKAQKNAKDKLSEAWKKLENVRKPQNATKVAQAERELAEAQRQEVRVSNRLDGAWKKLTEARQSGNPRAIALAEKEIAEAQRQEERVTGRLDKAFANLEKVRKPQNARQVAQAEREIANAQDRVDRATKSVDKAQRRLNRARESGSSVRIQEAQEDLADAQNAQATALDKASRGSRRYKTALAGLHAEAGKLAPAFRKAFTPAAATFARLTTSVLRMTRNRLPMLGEAADKSLKKFAKGAEDSQKSSSKWSKILDDIPPIMKDIGQTFGNFSSAWTSFMDVAMPHVRRFTQWLAASSKRLAEWADSKKGRDQIKEFLDLAVPMAESLGRFLKTVGKRLFELAKEHGPTVIAAIDLMTVAVEGLISVLDKALDVATFLVNRLKELGEMSQGRGSGSYIPTGSMGGGHVPRRRAYGGDEEMAHGGTVPLYTAANGLSRAGAHFVEGPNMMQLGSTSVLYGEALSGNSREYAFPMEGGYRFITEQPGYDANSFALWKDLGERKGFFPTQMAYGGSVSNTAPSRTSSDTSLAKALGRLESMSARTVGMLANVGKHLRFTSKVDRYQMAMQKRSGAQVEYLIRTSRGSQMNDRRVLAAMERMQAMEAQSVAALYQVRTAVESIPSQIKESMDHNLQHGRNTRTQVLKGLSREAGRKVFEGSL